MNSSLKICVMAVVLLSAGMAMAGDTKVKLEVEHGKDLTKAAFVIRYKFLKTTGVDWKQSTHSQRKKFLEKWYADLEKERQRAQEKAKQEREKARQAADEKREQEAALKDKLQHKKELEKKKKEEEKARQEEFEDKVKQREKELKEMRLKDEMRKQY